MSRRKQQLVMMTIMIVITIVLMALISDAKIINITNKLGSKKTLIVHCESVDDDLGVLAVNSGDFYHWDFEDSSLFRPAVFWCRLALEDGRLSFVAYIEREGGGGYAVMGYDVNETGLYGPNMYDEWRKYELLHPWKRIQFP
ncbi:unnamed protein product [Linum trigynum]|uniref:S-protein homolog n=1 Tax=Linum trigynum TaxID=586398 RepID=A0AAV2D3R9_9ROSI